ncbi:sensor histidine kinase [Plantactinospora endophytica]|uniref:histidine kinase n=1 Tax=Plantactinospora endophytica TaxID=673535 RepID=A0ABQ4DTK3_9ACTN|nr:sensor histidine kinase [Plantactinospora endophytica]GIG85777.1 two-component sensor histidine kinase [Plantactinospora endophytica]
MRDVPPAPRSGAGSVRPVDEFGPAVLRGLRDRLRRHPRWVDAGLVVLLGLVSGPVALADTGVAAWLWFGAVHAPLVWRRRAPVLVCWSVYGLAVVSAVLEGIRVNGIHPELVVAVAIYTVARYRPQRYVWPILAATEIPAAVLLLPGGPHWTALGFVTCGLAATVLLGITVRIRRAYLAELEERARRLERERDQRARLAVAAERARIARDLHDIVAHNLAVMVALADGASYAAGTAPERAAETMAQVSATGRQALGEMRRLLGLLRDDAVGRAPQPGLDDLAALVAQVRSAGPRIGLTVDGAPTECGPGVGLAAYRIVQEALTNTLKHAGPAAEVRIRLDFRPDGLHLEIVDDGAGRTATPGAGDGHGLAGMIERATAYGGEVEAGPRPDGPGWRVRARLRLDDEKPT